VWHGMFGDQVVRRDDAASVSTLRRGGGRGVVDLDEAEVLQRQ